MGRYSLVLCLVLGVTAPFTGLFGASKPAARERPNILLILSDDMGYSDIGAMGGEIRTPVLDQLASRGKVFTQFYNTSRCCPTRASLLTGLYPHQAGIGHMAFKTPHRGYGGFLSADSITIAEVLREAGYRTYMAGKWHLAPRGHDPRTDLEHWPTRRGFEKFYGTIAGYGSFWDPATLCRGETFITPENDPEYRPKTFYYTDAITDNAIAFLEEHARDAADKPFFLYLAHTAAHWPLHAPEEAIREYDGQYNEGFAAIHRRRIARLRELGLMPEVGEIAEPAGDWESVANKEVEAALMETYAAMVTCMDEGIGRVIEFLRASGQLDNTLILYLQDNGGNAEDWFGQETVYSREFQPMGPDELQTRTRAPMPTRDGRPVRTGRDIRPGPADTYTAYKENWANVSNAPFRKYKHYVHEGGISTPFIVQWPDRIRPEPYQRLVREPAHLIDIMATCLDAAGVQPPAERKGVKLQPLEGVSLMPVLTGSGALGRREPLFWEHEGNRAVREENWKLVSLEGDPGWELYDMSIDRGEMNDVAVAFPHVVARLAAKWSAWADRSRVFPLGGWMDRVDETTLHLKQGDKLAAAASPVLAGRGVTAVVKVLEGPANGVLLAQGSRANGYAVYIQNDTLSLVMRCNGELHRAEMRDVPPADFTVFARISANGSATLGIDDRRIYTGFGGGFPSNPVEGLRVGFDVEDPTGDYPKGFRFRGKLGFVTIRGTVNKEAILPRGQDNPTTNR